MASRAALLILFNILFFTAVSATSTPCPPPPKPKCACAPPPHKSHSPPKTPSGGHTPPKTPSPTPPSPTPPKTPGGSPTPPTTPGGSPPPTPSQATCPQDILKLGVCANLLSDLVSIVVGNPENTPCCSLLGGLADLDAAVCLCTAIKANVLGINLNVPVSLSLLLNYCGKKVPSGFQCE